MKKFVLILLLSTSLNVYGQSCSEIKTYTDRFHGVTTNTSPVLAESEPRSDNKSTFNVFAIKQDSEFETEYAFMFAVTTPNLDFSGHGIILSLDNGLKIDKPGVKLIFEDGSEDVFCKYSARIVLDKDELGLLLKNKITGLRFFAYESQRVHDFNIENHTDNLNGKIIFYLNCLADDQQ